MYVTAQNDPQWVAEQDRPGHYLHRIYTDTRAYDKNDTHIHLTEPATEEQIAHLKACIAAGEYVEYNENMLAPNYEIY